MRTPFVAGNWKLNGSKSSIESLLASIKAGVDAVKNTQVAVCPPYIYLAQVQAALDGAAVGLGAQDVSDRDAGAFTGEVSAAMLKEFGCRYAIVGHSERRHIYGESDERVAAKFAAARRAGLTPILCVGELLEERERGETERVIARQLEAVIDAAGIERFRDAVVAYEPVWAIGTGQTATPEQAQAAHAFIRQRLRELDAATAEGLRIQYGGSVKAANAAELFAQPDIDGGLIGGASLNADEFLEICGAAG